MNLEHDKMYRLVSGYIIHLVFISNRFLTFFVDNEGYPINLMFDEEGKNTSYTRNMKFERGAQMYCIESEYEGWIGNPFEGAPEWATHRASDLDGRSWFFKEEPYKRKWWSEWDIVSEYGDIDSIERAPDTAKYYGDWGKSVVSRGDYDAN